MESSRAARFALAAGFCAVAAAWLSFTQGDRSKAELGAKRVVIVAGSDLNSGAGGDELVTAARERTVPARFAPPDALGDALDLSAARLLVDLPRGAFITRSLLADAATSGRFRLRRGERALTVEAVVGPLGSEPDAGDRVDLYASGFRGAENTTSLINGAEVLASETVDGRATRRLTLRLAAAQVAGVIRADVFARELRAVMRTER